VANLNTGRRPNPSHRHRGDVEDGSTATHHTARTRTSWYDQGGTCPSGTVGINTSGGPETVRNAPQDAAPQRMLAADGKVDLSDATIVKLTQAIPRVGIHNIIRAGQLADAVDVQNGYGSAEAGV
jgi:hypothetical protein